MKWDKYGFGRATVLERLSVWVEDHPGVGILLCLLVTVGLPVVVVLVTQ